MFLLFVFLFFPVYFLYFFVIFLSFLSYYLMHTFLSFFFENLPRSYFSLLSSIQDYGLKIMARKIQVFKISILFLEIILSDRHVTQRKDPKKREIRHNVLIFLHQIVISFKVFSIVHNALLQTILPLFNTVFKFTYRNVLYAFQRFLF